MKWTWDDPVVKGWQDIPNETRVVTWKYPPARFRLAREEFSPCLGGNIWSSFGHSSFVIRHSSFIIAAQPVGGVGRKQAAHRNIVFA